MASKTMPCHPAVFLLVGGTCLKRARLDKPTVAHYPGRKISKLIIYTWPIRILCQHSDMGGFEMHKTGFTLLDLVVVICVLIVVFAILLPFLSTGHHHNYRAYCSNNLKQIFTSMYTYSQDSKGAFPQVVPGQIILGEDKTQKNLKPGSPDNPFKDFPAGANHSVSENLWLLCRDDFAHPELFVCPNSDDAGNKVNLRDITNSTTGGAGPEYFINFPWQDPNNTISYSFIQPWSRFGDKGKGSWDMWSADADPRLVMGADANNNIQPDYKGENNRLSAEEIKKYINSTNHEGEGQNCLYGDGHVSWSMTSYMGIGDDNIYTAMLPSYSGRAGDTSGVLSVRPKDEKDTVLIPNKDADLAKWNRKP
jgi:hypothetical protein